MYLDVICKFVYLFLLLFRHVLVVIYLKLRNNLSYLYNDKGLYLHVCGQLNAMMLAGIIPAFTLTKH